MNKKICVTSYVAVGCTFVDWSLQFLSGQTQYYNVKLNQWLPLSHNPLTAINAHGHQKNHPMGYSDTRCCFEKFDSLATDGIYSAYPIPLYLDSLAAQAQITVDQFHNPTVFRQVQEIKNNDYNKILQSCSDHDIVLVFVSHDPRSVLYHQNIRTMTYATKPVIAKTTQDIVDEHQDVFFPNSQTTWQNLNLNEIWDVRERMALDIRPYSAVPDYKFDFQLPHHWINCLQLWTDTQNTIKRMMDYLDLEIVEDRWQAWLPICKNWQGKQLLLLEFCYNQPHIVEAIVNNWYYEIDLTFQQEVLIQHFLIYQYGLNLKTWQLEKFPSNTQDLHKLLEPNIHPIPKIY